MAPFGTRELTIHSVSPSTGATPHAAPKRGSSKRARTSEHAAVQSPVPSSPATSNRGDILSQPASPSSSNALTRTTYVTPFKDCIDTFRTYPNLRFARPQAGHINGYVKIKWGTKTSLKVNRPSPLVNDKPAGSSFNHEVIEGSTPNSSQATEVINLGDISSSFAESVASVVSDALTVSPSAMSSVTSPMHSDGPPSPVDQAISLAISQASTNNPKRVPPHFGHPAKMAKMDRSFWEFCKSTQADDYAVHYIKTNEILTMPRCEKLVSGSQCSSRNESLAG